MENKLIFKIFATYKTMQPTSMHDFSKNLTQTLTQACFEYMLEFEELEQAINWRKEQKNFENMYTIVPCY